jgi:hypothetical protein
MEGLAGIISDFFNSIDPTATLAGLKCRSAAVSCHAQVVLSLVESTGGIRQ